MSGFHRVLSNLPFPIKFAISPVIALLLMGVMAYVAGNGLEEANTDIGFIVEHHMEGSAILADVRARTHDLDDQIYRLLTDRAVAPLSPEVLTGRADMIKATSDAIATDLTRYQDKFANDDQKKLINEALKNLSNVNGGANVVVSMLDIDFAAAASFVAPFDKVFSQLAATVDTINAAALDDSHKRAASARQAAHQVKALFLLIALAAALVIAMTAWQVGESTTRSIQRIARTTLDLARENTAVDVDTLIRRDELGEIVESLRIFRTLVLERQHLQELQVGHQRELENQVTARTAELRREVEVRSLTEVALRASRERLKAITDNLFEGVVVVDRNGQLMFVNRSAYQLLLGFVPSEDQEGFPLDHLIMLRTVAGDIGFMGSPWQRVMAENVTLRDDDAVFVRASGALISVAYACSPLGADVARRAAIISFRDIETLKQVQREAMQASRLASVGQLAAGIAHEINTPVQYIGDNLHFIAGQLTKLIEVTRAGQHLARVAAHQSGLEAEVARFNDLVELAKLSFVQDEVPGAVQESLEGVGQIARIVLSMKEFSYPSTGTKVMVDINHAVENTLVVSRNVWKHVAEIATEFDSELPSVPCLAGEMNQVFLNLVVNAAHAIEASGKPYPGRITVTTGQRDGSIWITVADTGDGVPPEIRDRIFDPFFTTKTVGKGTGQGLAICRDVVVTKHGGMIEVGQAVAGGAVFVVKLPMDGGAREGQDVDV